jgi:hypothetical protein
MLFRKAKKSPTDPRRAERILNGSLETIRQDQPDDATPLSFLKTRLQAQAAQQTSRKDSAMSRAANILKARPKSGLAALIVVAVFLGVTLVPFSYTSTVGYTVEFADTNQPIKADPNELAAAMASLGLNDVWANYNSDGANTVWTLSNLPDESAANTAAVAFRTLTGTAAEPVITPVRKQVSGTLYAQVKEQLETMTFSVTDASSPEEMEAQIRGQLIAAGYECANVHVITNEQDGTVTIDLEIGQ